MSPFAPVDNIARLPERAPIRTLRPDLRPGPLIVRPRLAAEGVDPDAAGAIVSALFRRGWAFWLVGSPGPPRRFHAFVLEPRFWAAWAEGNGGTPAEALGSALVQCLDEPPWERRPEDDELDLDDGGGG